MSDKTKKITIERLSPHSSGVRSFFPGYKSFASLNDARANEDTVVVFEGDDGGQIYAVCPLALVKCDENALRNLLLEIDAMVWKDPTIASVLFEQLPVGSGVAGGMGGGMVTEKLWLHPTLDKEYVRERIEAVIDGRMASIHGK